MPEFEFQNNVSNLYKKYRCCFEQGICTLRQRIGIYIHATWATYLTVVAAFMYFTTVVRNV